MPYTGPEKLVRDRIPEIIESKGENPVTHTVEGEEFKNALKRKLIEELREVVSAGTPQDMLEEIADMMEIIRAIVANYKSTFFEIVAQLDPLDTNISEDALIPELENVVESLLSAPEEEVLTKVAELLRIFNALAISQGASFEQLVEIMEQKKQKRGGFDKGIILERTESKQP